MALKYAYFMLFQNISWKGQFISCLFKLLQQFFLTYPFCGNKKRIRVSYGNKCRMRYLVKIGSGMCDPYPNVLISIQNIFISKNVCVCRLLFCRSSTFSGVYSYKYIFVSESTKRLCRDTRGDILVEILQIEFVVSWLEFFCNLAMF